MGDKSVSITSEKRNILFSPPDVGGAEAKEVSETILSGWITTGDAEILWTCF